MSQKPRIYLDHNATTPLDPHVARIMAQELFPLWGNPSSLHREGQAARARLVESRQIISSFLGVKPSELIFTSSGTEALNMVIRGFFGSSFRGHILTSNVEHSAVFATVKQLQSYGCEATFLSPGLWGAVTLDAVKMAIQPNTRLIALMAVNNETGVKTDIEAIAAFAQERGIPLVVDGVALLGKELIRIPPGVSAMCFSGHKCHAPKGSGLAVIRSSLKLEPFITGGEQEFGRRGGTEDLMAIAGLAEAVKILQKELPAATERMSMLRDRLEEGLIEQLSQVTRNGQGPRICNTSNLSFGAIEGEVLLTSLDLAGIAVSHGSACASGALEPSRILVNMGVTKEQAESAIRFSLSRFTTEQEIDACIEIVCRVVRRLEARR